MSIAVVSGVSRSFGIQLCIEAAGTMPETSRSAVPIVMRRKPQKMKRWCLLVRWSGPSSATFF